VRGYGTVGGYRFLAQDGDYGGGCYNGGDVHGYDAMGKYRSPAQGGGVGSPVQDGGYGP
jgi:hypothetical protein